MCPEVARSIRALASDIMWTKFWKRFYNWYYGRPRPLKRCSFCRRTSMDAGQLVEGPLNVFICLSCAETSRDLLLTSKPRGSSVAPSSP